LPFGGSYSLAFACKCLFALILNANESHLQLFFMALQRKWAYPAVWNYG